jgi:hypothetical protein
MPTPRQPLVVLAIIALLVTAAFAPVVGAQVVAGRVVDSASTLPIPGAVIQALAADGSVRGRTLSDGRGNFALRVSDTADIQIRVQRIGFRPRLLRPLAGTAAPLEIALARIPALLDPMRVVAAPCRRRGRTSPIGLIEQARAGLLASIVARDVNPAAMTRIIYEWRNEPEGIRNTSQLVRIDSSLSTQSSFGAVHDAAGFARRGFLEEDEGGQTYFAPDAETLLDDAFAAGYCFRVMPGNRERPNQVGLGFEAAQTRRGRVDVTGALWIDTVARELRDIEFRYVGLPNALEAERPGGRIEFVNLPNGITIVSRWHLDLVGVERDSLANRRPGRWESGFRRFGYRNGGELARASWRDGTEWRARLGTLAGTSTWADGQPASGVTYALRGTPYRATSDSAGHVVIHDIVPGTYTLMVLDAALLALGLGIETDILLHSNRDTVVRSLRGLTADDYVVAYCRTLGRYSPSDQTFVIARALWEDGTPIQGATWSAIQLLDGERTEIELNGRTGSDGVIAVCRGLARTAGVELRVATPDGQRQVRRAVLEASTTVLPAVFLRP